MTHPADPGRDDDERREDESHRADERRPRGIIRSLLELLREMDERGERTRRGQGRPGGHTSVDYSISVGDLSSAAGEDPFETWWSRRDAASAGDAGPADDGPTDVHVTTRETPDGLVVVADLPAGDADGVDTRLEEDAGVLLIAAGGGSEARLPLDDEGWHIVDSRLANGILEVTLRRD